MSAAPFYLSGRDYAAEMYLVNTMKGLEAGLTVGTIASSPIMTCSPTDDPAAVLSEWPDFDVIPVEDQGQIVAIVERSSESRRPLDSGMLVASGLPRSISFNSWLHRRWVPISSVWSKNRWHRHSERPNPSSSSRADICTSFASSTCHAFRDL